MKTKTNEARVIPPLVSTEWLAGNLDDPRLVLLDIREGDEYGAGHLPGAVPSPAADWFVTRGGLLLELPDEKDLFATMGAVGIKADSLVVIVTKTDLPYPLADGARVAVTLLYGGLKNVALLDGGYNKWVKEKRPLSRRRVKTAAGEYAGETNRAMFVSLQQVLKRMGKALLVDTRDPDVYFGLVKEPFTERAGHIPGAICLPAPWLWTEEGTYRDEGELRAIAGSLFGRIKTREIILYCGVGGYASAWLFVLRELLGYKNCKMYDGSAQEWTRDPSLPTVCYRWG